MKIKESVVSGLWSLVCGVIHCVGQSLTPRVWVRSYSAGEVISTINYQVSNTKTNEGTLSLTSNIYISTPRSPDWSWARSNYMNNRQRGINQRRHVKIIPRHQLSYSRVSRNIILYWRLSVMRDICCLSCQTESDWVWLSLTVSSCLFEWH